MKDKFHTGTFTHSLTAFCFECDKPQTVFKRGGRLTVEEGSKILKVLGWNNTPRGWNCVACQEAWAESVVETLSENS